ncbi:increased loss of mitochondrial DNA protein 1 [Podospora fimiseda]|uniref:Increased loss of mitochondrial DNA protein 1 n=1 Tax=Podospora fimiseda TaxID=252190 RepID=A0AAN7BTV4_9PEZI|nr:increased loss of mitochondrial DNA protein 1 [Podospora fimiseda]
MPLISSKTILTSISLFHLTLAFFLLTSPQTISDQAIIYLLGESLGLPHHSRSFESQSPALAFLAVVLAFLGVTDLVTLSLPDEVSLLHHWTMQVPLRTLFSLVLSSYSFLFSPSSPLFSETKSGSSYLSHPVVPPSSHNYVPTGWGGDALKNRVFFTFAFVETVGWFWVWVTLGEERRGLIMKKERKERRERERRGSNGW